MTEPTSSCWNCSTQYPILTERCPECAATNANVDYEAACVEMECGILEADLAYDSDKRDLKRRQQAIHSLTLQELNLRRCIGDMS